MDCNWELFEEKILFNRSGILNFSVNYATIHSECAEFSLRMQNSYLEKMLQYNDLEGRMVQRNHNIKYANACMSLFHCVFNTRKLFSL